MKSDPGGCAYVVTAHKQSAVTHSVVGQFTSPDDLNLIVTKSSRVEVNLSTDVGLKPITEFNVYGKIAVIEVFRYKNEKKDCIFILTESCYACILEYVDGKIITRAYGDMRDKNYSVSQSGMHACIDPEARCIALRLYDGVLKVINLNSSSKHLTTAEQRIEEIQVVDMCFLHTANKPTLALLYDDNSVS